MSRGKTEVPAGRSEELAAYESIYEAICQGRVPPGTKLAEEQLVETFGISRGRARRVLQDLAKDKVVVLEPNRGAFVAEPSPEDAKNVFDARKCLEASLAKGIVENATEADVKRLRKHVEVEHRQEQGGSRSAELKTSHDFHVLLAEVYGNQVIVDILKDLMAQSALITAIYERPNANVCSHASHEDLIDLIERKDVVGLRGALVKHLDELEAELELTPSEEPVVDLRAILTSR